MRPAQEDFQQETTSPESDYSGNSPFGAPTESRFGNPGVLYQEGLQAGLFRG